MASQAAADVVRGTVSGCNAALRPRGIARVAHARRTWRGHAITQSTWAPMWGATWHAGRWRAHGNSGALVTLGDGNAMLK